MRCLKTSTRHALMTFILDLQSFREALGILQRHVDELDDLKAAHYHEIIEHEEQVWDVVQGKVRLSQKLLLFGFTLAL